MGFKGEPLSLFIPCMGLGARGYVSHKWDNGLRAIGLRATGLRARDNGDSVP